MFYFKMNVIGCKRAERKDDSMKKIILALLLSAGICIAGVQADAVAAETVKQETDEGLEEEYVDLSGSIVQEGGFLPEMNTSGRRMTRAAVDDTAKEQAQKALMAAWDSFETTCDLSSYQIPKEEIGTVFQEAINLHPRYFYVSGGFSYYSNAAGNVTKMEITYTVDKNTAV